MALMANRQYSMVGSHRKTMDETFKAKDKQLKVLLATLEYKARKCKECIERRLAVRN